MHFLTPIFFNTHIFVLKNNRVEKFKNKKTVLKNNRVKKFSW